ncbi:MAG: hypothetical protein IT379_42600, partial [Deltaproteobacteria bacterium]|nr:hypothetical protein [Deltaproteobacteria bacterium]
YDAVIAGLADRGIADVARVPFDPDLTGRTLSAFFVGTASLGTTIEGNDFAPGALVDNLTSFGAVPQNFAATGESQVSIARWVARGVAGVHGTTDEPLANCFPARRLLLDYVDGGTLAEAYARNMPFVYWQNLVLGDPMAAPYATRPVVRIEGATDGERIVGSRRLEVTATDPDARGPVSIRLWIDGLPVASSEGAPLAHCVAPAADGPVSVLAVAQAADDGTDRGLHRPKGWTSIRLEIAPGDRTCTETTDAGAPIDSGTSAPDASASTDAGSVLDAGAHDAGGGARDADGRSDAARPADRGDGGCGCRVAPSRGPLDGRGRERARSGGLLLALVGSLVLSRAKRRARAARARQAAGRAA